MPAKIRYHLNQLEKLQSFPEDVLTRSSPASICGTFVVSLSRHHQQRKIDYYEVCMIVLGATPPRICCDFYKQLALPVDIVLKGVQIARACPICQSQQKHMHARTIKSQLATAFNQIVQHGALVMWALVFMSLTDEA
eukprot:3605055-Pyramimonas_sp.AAC.1